MGYWNDPDSQLKEMARCASHTTTPQLRHRMALVELWGPSPGDRVLEVGCGHGDTTVALAQAVGLGGEVVAIDRAAASYGGPTTLSDAHTGIKSSHLGQRIDFRLSTDLLSPDLAFQYGAFDLVVFSHCSWYMSPAAELQKSFERVRPWARRLGYAEWDLVPRTVRQMPHFVAILLQIHIRTVWSNPTEGNIYGRPVKPKLPRRRFVG